MNKEILLATLIGCLAVTSIPAQALTAGGLDHLQTCQVEFDGDIHINPDRISVTNQRGQVLQIHQDQRLLVNGEQLELDGESQKLIEAYARQVRQTLPEIINLALEGVEVGFTAVSEVFASLTGKAPPASLTRAINNISESISEQMNIEGDSIHMKGGEIGGLEDRMDALEPALRSAVAGAIGDMVMSMGQAIKEEDDSMNERMANLVTRMSNLEADIEARVRPRADILEQRATKLCARMQLLGQSEDALQQQLPALVQFDLVKRHQRPQPRS